MSIPKPRPSPENRVLTYIQSGQVTGSRSYRGKRHIRPDSWRPVVVRRKVESQPIPRQRSMPPASGAQLRMYQLGHAMRAANNALRSERAKSWTIYCTALAALAVMVATEFSKHPGPAETQDPPSAEEILGRVRGLVVRGQAVSYTLGKVLSVNGALCVENPIVEGGMVLGLVSPETGDQSKAPRVFALNLTPTPPEPLPQAVVTLDRASGHYEGIDATGAEISVGAVYLAPADGVC